MKYLIILLLLVSCGSKKLEFTPTDRPMEHFFVDQEGHCSGYVELTKDGAIVRGLYCQSYDFTAGDGFGDIIAGEQVLVDGQQVIIYSLDEMLRLREHLRRYRAIVGNVDENLDEFMADLDLILDVHPDEVFN